MSCEIGIYHKLGCSRTLLVLIDWQQYFGWKKKLAQQHWLWQLLDMHRVYFPAGHAADHLWF